MPPGLMPPGLMPPGSMRPGLPPLRLRAEDAEDLAVLSACLQDALVAVRDFAYDPGARVFIMAANRFRWEGCRPDAGAGVKEGGQFGRHRFAIGPDREPGVFLFCFGLRFFGAVVRQFY